MIGELLFEFDVAGCEDDRNRLKLVAESLAASTKAAGEDGDLEQAIRDKGEIVRRHEAAEASLQGLLAVHQNVVKLFEESYGVAVTYRPDARSDGPWRQARAAKDAIGIVTFQLSDARAMLAAAKLDLQRARWAVEDFQRLQPIVDRIYQVNDERLRQTTAQLRVTAPAAGEVGYIEPSGWVERGTVIARYKPLQGIRIERAAQCTRSGSLLRQLVPEGDRVAVGQVIAQLDASELQLKLLYLELSQAQLAAQSLRLERGHRDASENALTSRLEAARERKRYQSAQVQHSKSLYENGLVMTDQVREAQAAYDSAAVNEAMVEADVLAAQRAVKSVSEALDLQSRLAVVRANELGRENEALVVRATRAGRVRWLVAEGSFVAAGAWVAAVEL